MATSNIGPLVAATIALAAPATGLAQSMTTNSAAFNAGWGRAPGSENHPVDPAMTDANGNLVVVNGLFQGGAASSVFASGAATAFAGVGASASGSASAIGNSLNVVVQGDNNTVVVNSTQTNTGAVTATSSAKP